MKSIPGKFIRYNYIYHTGHRLLIMLRAALASIVLFNMYSSLINRILVTLLLCCAFLVTIPARSCAIRDQRPSLQLDPPADAGVVVCNDDCLYIVINFPTWEGCNTTYPNSTQVGILMNHLQGVS